MEEHLRWRLLDEGYILRAGDPVLTGNFSGLQYGLITAGPSSVDFHTPGLG